MAFMSKIPVYAATAALLVTCVYAAFSLFKRYKKSQIIPANQAFKLNINLISSAEECESRIYELRRRSMGHNAIGFDCEWVTHKGKKKPVALLQLATYDGFCVLIRLNLIAEPLPPSLTALLEDTGIYKVGVAPLDDAKYLYQDHGVRTVSTVDLRHFAKMCGHSVGGLAHLSESLLGVLLDKSFKVRCSNWDAETLTPAQLHYAASDAYAAIQIFVKLVDNMDKTSYRHGFIQDSESIWEAIDNVCNQFADNSFKHKNSQKVQNINKVKKEKEYKEPTAGHRYPHLKRSRPLYDNCFLQAPDGEVLSTIDSKKAKWYIAQGLADVICDSPLTVRLRFEPAGRSVGEVGQYYTQVKENKCVVCGEQDSYIRKNVVPREYRKYFPELLKDHSSHDIVLLCGRCHQRSNIRDQSKREQLAVQCKAPLPTNDASKCVEDRQCKKVRMSARALYNEIQGKYSLPEARRMALEAEVLDYFSGRSQVTDDLLQEAMWLSVMVKNENCPTESHGQAVVRHYLTLEEGGLLLLEEMWRDHFIAAMRPRHMPALWSRTHTLDRLRVKWKEGRLSEKQLETIGNVEHLFM